jgi:cytoskeletal protein CcmA (bactofilin family)
LRRCLILLTALLAAPAAAAAESPALVLEEGAIARQEMVAIGRDLEVRGEALADVAALDGDALISGRVDGDVIVLGGDVQLTATARVGGDVFALGGEVRAAAGAEVAGRTVSHPTVNAAWLTLLEGPTVGLEATDPLVLGAKLALLTAWLALVLLLFATSGREVLAISESVAAEPFRNFFLGLTASLTLVLAGIFFTAFSAALVGVPMLVLVVLAALVLKLWGMVAVFHAAGRWLFELLGRRRPAAALNVAVAGLAALGLFKLLPWVGAWVWTAATLIGIGATLETKFGRREPWFALDAEAPRRAA